MSQLRPPIVGLTGGIASGKSVAARCFAECGWQIVDTDVIARALTAPGGSALDAIRTIFGELIFDGAQLNRPRLRDIVFGDTSKRHALEALMHPLIRAEARRQLDGNRAPVLLVVPLLAENLSAWRPLVDTILVIDCDEATQIARLNKRDAFSPSLIRSILAAQSTRADRLAIADHVVVNSGTAEALCEAIKQFSASLLRSAM